MEEGRSYTIYSGGRVRDHLTDNGDSNTKTDLRSADQCVVGKRELNTIGATGTATNILVILASLSIASSSHAAISITLVLAAIGSLVYQWVKIGKLKDETEIDADTTISIEP